MQTAEKKPETWAGDPIYRIPSACRDDRNTWRVFHRDIEGRIVAEFVGPNAEAAAWSFCRMFGEPSRSRQVADQ